MREVVAFFACAAAPRGKELGWEMLLKCARVTEELRRIPEADLLIAQSAQGYEPTDLYHRLTIDVLCSNGITADRIKVCGDSASTASEIDSMEAWIVEHPEYSRVYVATSGYHIPRTRFMWRQRHGRKTLSMPLHVPLTSYIMARTAMEPLKFAALLMPTKLQDFGNDILRILGLN